MFSGRLLWITDEFHECNAFDSWRESENSKNTNVANSL